jgi:hypothetical protein
MTCFGWSMSIWKKDGMKVAHGTIVDASNINAPGSTRNKDKQRYPEMAIDAQG